MQRIRHLDGFDLPFRYDPVGYVIVDDLMDIEVWSSNASFSPGGRMVFLEDVTRFLFS
jgi:hypothetical protein